MESAIDHVCEAVHCVTCCPVNRAWSDGYESGEKWSRGLVQLEADTYKRALEAVVIVCVIVAVVMLARKRLSK